MEAAVAGYERKAGVQRGGEKSCVSISERQSAISTWQACASRRSKQTRFMDANAALPFPVPLRR